MTDRSPRFTRVAAVVAAAHVPAALFVWWLAYSQVRSEGELEGVILLAIGIGLLLVSAGVLAVAIGLWRDRGWARVAALLTFSLIAAGSMVALIDTAGRLRGPAFPYGAPPRHLAAPAATLVGSATVVVLLLASRARRRSE